MSIATLIVGRVVAGRCRRLAVGKISFLGLAGRIVESGMIERPDTGWHLDKRVPIAIIAALLAQTFVIGAWVGVLSQRVTHLEQSSVAVVDMPSRIRVLEASLANLAASQRRIEDKLDRVIERTFSKQ